MPISETWTEKDQRLQAGPRLRALEDRLVRLEGEDDATARRTLRSVHLLLLDATLDGDVYTLDAALDGLRHAESLVSQRDDAANKWRLLGRVETLREHALLALERVPSVRLLTDLEPESQSARFLAAIAADPGSSNDAIAAALGVSPERISHLGRELVQRGLARKRKVGRRNSWDLTPRGGQVAELIEAGGTSRPQREHRLPALG